MFGNLPGIYDYLALGTIVFFLGILGVALNTKNYISSLICLEVMLLGVNINFLAVAGFIDAEKGILGSVVVLSISAVEAAVGLAIITVLYRTRSSVEIQAHH